ncbi:hypothetical protein C817_01282 [Dorea sp. 5-2]|nr:hypothetical protein C817_01282 [Dorea sp. 5-2]
MNREEYMKCLTHRLRRLPKEDFDKAISYYTEYFEEAGPENEAQAIHDLGSPELAADQIIRNIAAENAKEPIKDVRHGFYAVWIGILAVFAAPIGIPLALTLGILALTFVFLILVLIFCVFVVTISVAVSAIPCIVIGVWMLFTSFADGMATIGIGLIGLGIGYWLIVASVALGKGALHLMTRLFGRVAKGGNTKKN